MTSPWVYCPGCGKKSYWRDVCEHCGYKIELAKDKWRSDIKTYFCTHKDCGCTYGNAEGNCPTHGPFEEDVKTPVDWPPRSDQ